MTDRTVVYRITSDVTGLLAGTRAGAASLRKMGDDALGATKKGGKFADNLDAMGINAGTAAFAVGTTMVVAAANFDQAMSNVQAATHESAANMDALRQAALDAGAQTAFSATEAAAGIENLAKAGVSTKDILGGGLSGALDLAAAGQLEVADASEIAATALTQFRLSGEDVPHVADLLAAGAGKAQGEVSDLSYALKQSGLVASQMGLSIEETTGTLAAFASAGLLGSDAGTSFRTMLLRLSNPSKKSAELMADLGINAYDAQGNFVGMASVAGQLQTALQDKTQAERDSALATIFGSDAIRAASVLYEQGSDGVEAWTNNVNDAGYAAETAAIKMDNLKGDIEALKGALETAFIEGGGGSQGGLRGLTQLATAAVNLSTETQNADGFLGDLRDTALGSALPMSNLGNTILGLKGFLTGADEKTGDLDENTASLAQTSVDAAGGLDAQAVSLEGVGGAVRQTAQEIEAADQALREAREAAHATAASFGQLGDGVDDSKVSLGQWIGQMANFADAVTNFMNNAKKASRRGLREGLINDLQDAGDAGALRMKQLANATDEEIARANRAWARGEKAMRDYVNFKVPPKKIDVDNGPALSKIEALEARLRAIRDEDVFINIRRVDTGLGPQTHAEGGYITGPGTATSDSIPAYLSNGEYVVKAAAVAKYGVGMFDRLNAMHFAAGGKVDKKKRTASGGVFVHDNTAALQQSIDRLTEVSEHQTQAVGEATSRTEKWSERMAEVAAATTAGFNTGLFDKDSNIWAAGAGGGPLANLSQDIAGLQERGALQTQLAGMGLSGDALAALLSQGTNADISGLINSGQVSQYADLYAQRAALQGSVGSQGASAAYGGQYANAAADQAASVAALQRTNLQLAGVRGDLARLERAIEDSADRTGAVVNGAAAGPARNNSRPKVGRL